MTLRQHLEKFGIKHFDDATYWDWGGKILSEVLSEKEFNHFEKLRKPLLKANSTPAQRLAFYEFIAKRSVAAVVHSTKADAICQSGEAIARKISSKKRILDIGCNSGYLTSWYATQHAESSVVGVDISYESVSTANQFFKELSLTNVKAIHGSPEVALKNEKFDCIIDSQSVFESFNRLKLLNWIEQSLEEDGLYVTVPQTANESEFEKYTREIESCNLEIVEFETVIFGDLGATNAYPLLVTKKTKDLRKFDASKAFQGLIEQLSIVRSS